MTQLIALVAVAGAVAAGTAFAASPESGPAPASAAADRAVVRQLRALRSEVRRSTTELKALNGAVGRPGTSSGGYDVLHELREICRTSERTALAMGEEISVQC
jgi:hypothetical protein